MFNEAEAIRQKEAYERAERARIEEEARQELVAAQEALRQERLRVEAERQELARMQEEIAAKEDRERSQRVELEQLQAEHISDVKLTFPVDGEIDFLMRNEEFKPTTEEVFNLCINMVSDEWDIGEDIAKEWLFLAVDEYREKEF